MADKHRPSSAIRPLYDQFGPDAYYQAHGTDYENPHLPQIEALLSRNFHRLDCSGGVLDFAAGGGEVSQMLRRLGVSQLAGSDPYTYELYEQKIGLPCARWSFMDVIRNGIPNTYSVIISSFALHLCPLKDLFPLAWNLFQAAPLLLVITPHKRPELEVLPGIELLWEDMVENERGKKVRLKAYRLIPHEAPESR